MLAAPHQPSHRWGSWKETGSECIVEFVARFALIFVGRVHHRDCGQNLVAIALAHGLAIG